ncbi:hypothetical protein [Phocaeicola paurosaccharolyticus]|jgi:hypothetical protein|uniref:hypothetical protein n=1 Tax=Phocaeicola paurosaccharolyticus TaxID=732242 RepID=UPI000AE42AFD|nr:hypothetical protein [Phocaeicola paurosaccharolyticus]
MNRDSVRNVLNILFMVLTVIAIVTYFAADDFKTFIYVCAVAVVVKVVEFILRFMC